MADVQEASLDSIDTDATFETTDSGIEDGFHAHWQQEDTAHLQPSNLPIARVQRAWERRPLSPLSRRKLRVGKVWKRPSQAQNNAVTRPTLAAEDGSGNDQRETKRFKARSSVNSPLKPVKKLCLDSDYGLAPRVAVWDGRPAGSPTRKIVTRSRFANGNANEDLLELDEDEDDASNAQGEEDSKVEFFDDQGALLDEDSADSGAWEDEEVYDPTMMHLEDAVHHEEVSRLGADGQQATQADTEHHKQADSPIESSYQTEEAAAEQNGNPQGMQQSLVHAPSTLSASHQTVDLPEGFVSPVRQRRKLRAGSFKKASGSRRETLPAQFAPPGNSPVFTETIEDAQISRVENPAAPNSVPASHAEAPTQATSGGIDGIEFADAGRGAENEWEDVEDDAETLSSHHPQTSADEEADEEHSTSFVLPVDSLGGAPASDPQPEGKGQDQAESESAQDPPSPANAFGLPPPKVALRHSPRRKSTSPLKPSALAPRADQPHYVAFTPIKQSNLSVYKDVPDSRGQDEESTPPSNTSSVEPSLSSLPDRALSAPAEEPSQTSPRRQPKPPRVSDDTALLQAFLNRAAERRSGRRVSATEQEALFHRRDSDVVKAALASPGKALDGTGTHEVLGELDSNRHSPKRTASAQSEATAKDVGMTDKPVDSHAAAESVSSEGEARHQEVPEDPIEEVQPAASNTRSGSTGSASRRSDRSRRKPQALAQQASTGPSRITIRGPHQTNAGISESNKRTEAQELALATKNNTRKNKGGSVLPMQRLNKLAKAAAGELGGVGDLNAEAATEESGNADANGKPGKKGVRWAETLVSFYQGSGTLADLAQLSDAGAEERMPWERPALASEDEETDKADAQSEGAGEEVVPAAPAPADTPSKPKGKTRKMRTPKTASAAGSTASGADTEMKDSKGEGNAPGPQQPQEETQSQHPAKPRTASQARRSRIATPAKSSSTSAQTSANVPQQQQQPRSQPATEPAKRTAPPAKKRTMTSRLPAPSSASTTSSAAATTLGSGKENLISSPPKKRTAAPSHEQQQQSGGAGIPSSKSFAPKLDFNDGKPATKFEQPTTATAHHSEGTSMPGLQSPARKTGARRAAGNAGAGVLFNGSSSLRQQEGRNAAHGAGAGSGGQGEGEVPMGLRSPAKRRVTRRTGV
ncbi:hypothetical protein KC323_g722 [Hortaea werneckii]|nr:hypothetical protein KC323_g722 [Hortaea werneckii]